jgi:hypothetical protein
MKNSFKVTQFQTELDMNSGNYREKVKRLESDFLEAQALVQQTQDQLVEFKANYKLSLTRYLQSIGNY